MLTGLRHRTVGRSDNEDSTIHLGSTGNHVLHIVSVARAVHVSVVTLFGLVLDVGGVDGDTALLLFRSVVDLVEGLHLVGVTGDALGEHLGNGGGEGGLTVVNVADGTDVDMRVMAAVRVVLPWSTWPMVPMLTCGLVLWNVSFAIVLLLFKQLLSKAQKRAGDGN